MSIGIGNLLNMFLHNGATNTVKAGVLHRSDPPQAILVESQADLEHLGEVPAGSIAYTAGYASMWQLSAAGSWEAIEEEGGSGGGGLVVHMNVDQSTHRAELDKTWKEINDALAAGGSVSIDNTRGGYSSMVTTMADETDYIVVAQLPSASANINSMKFFANAENELPVFSNGGES